jgi:hypothetical protein
MRNLFSELTAQGSIARNLGITILVIILGVLVLKWYRSGGRMNLKVPRRQPSLQKQQLDQIRMLVATQRGIILELRAMREAIRIAGEAILTTRIPEVKKEVVAPAPQLFVPLYPSVTDDAPSSVRSAADVRTLVSKVLRFEEIDPRARWMDLDVGGGAEWSQNRDVHLLETVEWGGPFIFVTDGPLERGWVLPNTSYGYSPEVLKPLYPNITEALFGSGGVEPVLVKRSNDGRWRVERSASFH